MVDQKCPICDHAALLQPLPFGLVTRVQCERCGTFEISKSLADDWVYERNRNAMRVPLACHIIRKYQRTGQVPVLECDGFMEAIRSQRLPPPAEAADRLVLWIGSKARDNPGQPVNGEYQPVAAEVGVAFESDVRWLLSELENEGILLKGVSMAEKFSGRLTFAGWRRFEALRRVARESNFAFFARKFDDNDLDLASERCFGPAVGQTGYELRMATQKAGLIDAVIENEIRRCKFLIADLSDKNAGAYWEAGFAEGLDKPVFYVCRKGVPTHFDTNHRNTVWWDFSDLNHAGEKLKALIRNTLLGDAKQHDT